jgi:hypothetical protein
VNGCQLSGEQDAIVGTREWIAGIIGISLGMSIVGLTRLGLLLWQMFGSNREDRRQSVHVNKMNGLCDDSWDGGYNGFDVEELSKHWSDDLGGSRSIWMSMNRVGKLLLS